VTDEHNGTGTASVAVRAGRWRVFATNEDSAGFYVNLKVVNGYPAISYFGYAGIPASEVFIYMRASDPLGTTWGDPVVAAIADVEPIGEWVCNSLGVVNGYPAIAFCQSKPKELWYVRAIDADGSDWGTPQKIDDMYADYYSLSLAVVNGNPAIAYEGSDYELQYVRASDPDGESWGSPIAADSDNGRWMSMTIINGNPAIAYECDRTLRYVRALDADGTAWENPVTVAVTPDLGYYISLAVVNGHPAIAYNNMNGAADYIDLSFVRANDPDGETWGSPVILEVGAGLYCSLAVINERAAIAHLGGGLKYIEARDLNGDDWRESVVVDDVEGYPYSCSLEEVNGHPAIGWCSGEVSFAIYY